MTVTSSYTVPPAILRILSNRATEEHGDVLRDMLAHLGLTTSLKNGIYIFDDYTDDRVGEVFLYNEKDPDRGKNALEAIQKKYNWTATIDPISRDLLQSFGTCIYAMTVLAYAMDVKRIDEPIGSTSQAMPSLYGNGEMIGIMFVELNGSQDVLIRCHIDISPSITWDDGVDKLLTITNLPLTVGASLEGRKLTDIVDHPVLNKTPFIIERVQTGEDVHVLYLAMT